MVVVGTIDFLVVDVLCVGTGVEEGLWLVVDEVLDFDSVGNEVV